MARRSYGTGSLYVLADRNGRESWYGHWRVGGRQVKRKIGVKRTPGTREGLTRSQAEARLRELIASTQGHRQLGERVDVATVAERYREHSERRGRKRSTLMNLDSEVRVHIAPFFRGKTLDAIRAEDVADFVRALEAKGLSPKTVRNIVATLSALFTFARAPIRGWATTNPCDGIELAAVPDVEEIRFLTIEEVRALIAHARPGQFHQLDQALYLTSAMTGLRKGELVALRWRDVDWVASRIRVRQNFVRGEFDTPKSRRSTRSVPMARELAVMLERLFQASHWQADEDLVFAHPVTGATLSKANISRRMTKALADAGVEPHRFHDLRHTFGTRMAAGGVAIRTLQEWMGHRDLNTTLRYADYAPSEHEAALVAAAFTDQRPEVAGAVAT